MDFIDDHFIVYEVLAPIAEVPPEAAPIIRYEQMKPEHVSRLWAFPSIITYGLAGIFDNERASRLLERGREADEKSDERTLGNILNEFLQKSKFLECPIFPPADENLLFADLLIGMANFILLGRVLSRYLENGETSQALEWSDSISFDVVKPGERFDAAVILSWLGKMITLATVRLNGAVEAANAGDDDAPWIPMPVESYFIKETTEVGGEILRPHFHRVGLHPMDEDGEAKEYELWTVFHENQTEYYSISFEFKPLWNIDDLNFPEKLCYILLTFEHDVRVVFQQLSGAWAHFVDRLDNYVRNDEKSATNVLNKFMSMDYYVDVSCSYHAFRKSVGSLNWHFEDDSKFKQFCRKYQLYYRKKHVPLEELDILREAMPAIRKLWYKIIENKDTFEEIKIRTFVKENADEFFFTYPDNIAKHGRKYHLDIDVNGEDNFIIDSLVTVSAYKGNHLNRTAIKKLYDSKMI